MNVMDVRAPDVSHLICEDGAPVDSWLAEKHFRLLTEPLYASWQRERPFLVASDVGIFAVPRNPAIVPDVFLSMDIKTSFPLTGPNRIQSYFLWEFGKPPDVVIEIVSDEPGGELTTKLRAYERMRVAHYVVFDPLRRLSEEELMTFTLDGVAYRQVPDARFERVGLGLKLWDGEYEGASARWLRWTDLDGHLIPTGRERADEVARQASDDVARATAEAERATAVAERATAEAERATAEAERATAVAERAAAEAAVVKERAERLAAKLRALGIDPDEG